ncbi:MAG: hypothetical protein WDZ37_02490 [Solirubrobacterales bacterium]
MALSAIALLACVMVFAPGTSARQPTAPKSGPWSDTDGATQYLLFTVRNRRVVDIDGGITLSCGGVNSAFTYGRGTVDDRIVLRGRGRSRHWEASLRLTEDDIGRQGVVDVGIHFRGRKRSSALITVETSDGQCFGSLALEPKIG